MQKRRIFILVGHPDNDSLSSELATKYAYGAEEAGHEIRRINLGELKFDPILHKGYKVIQELEPDLLKLQENIRWCDHFVILYPSWWGTMPALLKGMFDRMWLPKFAFKFSKGGWWWQALLKGRTATVFVLSDSPPLFARLLFGDSTNEIKRGILWFAGFCPIRIKKIGPLKNVSSPRVAALRQRFAGWGRKAL